MFACECVPFRATAHHSWHALLSTHCSLYGFTYSTRVGLATHLRCTKLENIGAHLSMSAGYGAYAWDERPNHRFPALPCLSIPSKIRAQCAFVFHNSNMGIAASVGESMVISRASESMGTYVRERCAAPQRFCSGSRSDDRADYRPSGDE